MALFVYVTDDCRKDAQRHSLSDELQRLTERIESSQSISHFDPFPPPYLVKKKLGGRQGRLIADMRRHGDNAVVVLLAIMMRGERAYESQFGPDPVGYGKQHFAHLVSDQQLMAYIEERSRVEPPPVKPQPSEAEYGFLYQAFAHRQVASEEDMVYETPEWKDSVSEPRISQQLVRFAELCLQALSKEPGIQFLDLPGKPGWGMWIYRREGHLLLIVPVSENRQEAAMKIVEHYRQQLGSGSFGHVLRASRRAYPAYMPADEETWVEIEREPVANMALSPEESDVLLSARSAEGAFPLFVNGRAGSGKSTILQYLFADLLCYYLSTPAARGMAPPVYLTANGELLRVARSFVERILRNESAFRMLVKDDLVEENREILDEAFREFQPYLLSMVDPSHRRERFSSANRVDYAQFRRLWTDWFGMDREAGREFGPDISWHVIRSYIKGMSSETLMDPDDYVQLPENQITVTPRTFERVYERVWEGRYAKIAEGQLLWDDQDLARYIVENNLMRPEHPAVLCDEAQDFTRIELELLLRLNLFSDRSVPPHDLSRIPFAFAGDQFQTLNPTGFRWDAIKTSFVEKFIQALDPAGRSGRAELNYRELRFNYRSTAPIVRFSNGIQALRAALFDMPETRPQTPWALSKSVFPVVWFPSSDPAFWKRFKEADSFVVIVPCNEGEEANYVRDDPILREHIRFDDGIPHNVLSAARAKGREYPAVIVYGFGDKTPRGLMDSLGATDSGGSTDRDQLLPNQYFINRLYVAASRPKQRLIIVDGERGIKSLWSFAHSEETARRVLDAANHGRTVWTVDPEDGTSAVVEGMTLGKVEDLTRESAGDPLENAKAFEADGRARKDAFLLRQATMAYRSAGDISKATECRARAVEIEGEFLQGGQAFSEAGLLVPDSIRCFWKAGRPGWERIIEAGGRIAAVSRETEFKWARALLDRSVNADTVTQLLQEVVDRLPESGFGSFVLQEPKWGAAIDTLVGTVSTTAAKPTIQGMLRLLDSLDVSGLNLPDRTMAELSYKAGNLQQAVARWERAGETKSEDYNKAKAATEPYPGKLTALHKTRAFDELVREFESHRDVPLDAEQWRVVGEAYLSRDYFEDAIDAGWETVDPGLLRRIALRALPTGQSATASRALHCAIVKMLAKEEWESLAKFASTLEFLPEPDWGERVPREFVDSATDSLQCMLARALSRSEKFTEMSGHLQRQFGEFLRRFLRVKEGRWRGHVSVEEAGAAIERGGKFTDALGFYEAVMREPSFTAEEKRFAQVRWLLSKHRQLEYERSQGAQSRKVSELQRELSEAMAQAGVKRVGDLSKYPHLDSLAKPAAKPVSTPAAAQVERKSVESTAAEETPTAITAPDQWREETTPQVAQSVALPVIDELPDRIDARVAGFSITYSRGIDRCNISQESTMQTAYVNLQVREAGGEKKARQVSPVAWAFDDWGIVATLRDDCLDLDFGELGSRLTIQRALTRPASHTEEARAHPGNPKGV